MKNIVHLMLALIIQEEDVAILCAIEKSVVSLAMVEALSILN